MIGSILVDFGVFAVHLGGAQKKGKDAKIQLIDSIRACLDEYSSVYVIEYEGMRSNLFKDVRMNFRDSRSKNEKKIER